jgi:phosphoribosylglycinamide formyltransferase-1
MSLTQLAIFASGAGTNAQKIIDYFRTNNSIKVALILCNKPNAGVLTIAQKENIPFIIIEKEKFAAGEFYLAILKEKKIDFLVLAGFLWKLPVELIKSYPKKIINIHPALLPKYGGKGMFGDHVHKSVINNNEKESGISVHYVDEIYDHGKIIFQAKCIIETNETAETLAKKIHALEHKNYPELIELVVNLKNIVKK